MIRQYLKIVRLHIVAGGLLAFTVGALLGLVNGGVFSPLTFAVCYASVFFGDLSTHYSNDYFDVKQDTAIPKKTLFKNPKVLTTNPEMLPTAQKISITLLAVSLLFAALAVLFKFAPIEVLLIMIGANFLGWFYSAPPLRLVSRGLGEVSIALAVGFAIPTVGYLSSRGSIDGWYGLFVAPFILYGFMLALSLEAPDVEVDRLGDKKTLGLTKGVKAVFSLAFAVALAAFLIFLLFALQTAKPPANLSVIAAISGVPLAAGFFGLIQINRGKNAQIPSVINVASLFLINLLMVAYLAAILYL